MPMNTTPGMYFQLAVRATIARMPQPIHMAATTKSTPGRDGRRPICGVGAGAFGGGAAGPPFGPGR